MVDEILADELHANQRTARAWVRTALSFVAVGLALAKLIETPFSNELGALFVALGFLIMVLGVVHARRTQRRLQSGGYHPNRASVAVVSAAFVVVTLVTIVGALV